jgi:hypothetical protein
MAIGNAVERDHFVYGRTYHITNNTNSQIVLAEMRSLKSRYPDFRVRAVDRTGHLIDLLE